jgi:quercetin dioxygenase-like cupin family protein
MLLSPEEAASAASVFFSGGSGPFHAPRHHQPSEEEFFVVLEGPLKLTVGDKTVDPAPAGAFGFAPRFATHTFGNTLADQDVWMFTMNAPGGHDRGFELAQRAMGSPRFGELIAAHGFQFHGV